MLQGPLIAPKLLPALSIEIPMLQYVQAMIGNSSSGIIEAPAFGYLWSILAAGRTAG
jgi:hypothetical protein